MSLLSIRKLGEDCRKEDQALWVENPYQIALPNGLAKAWAALTGIGHCLGMLLRVANGLNSEVDEVKGAQPLHPNVDGMVALQDRP